MRCDYYEAEVCRSCPTITTPYPGQLATKAASARAAVPDVAQWLPPVPSSQRGFRNKAKLVVGGSVSAPILGIASLDGPPGAVTDLSACPLHEAAIEQAIPTLRDFITTATLVPYDVANRSGELKFILITANPDGELMVRFVLRSREAEERIRKHLPGLLLGIPSIRVVSINIQPAHAAVLEGSMEIILAGDALPMRVNDIDLHLYPGSFFQTNTRIAAQLYRSATDWLTVTAPTRLWDLYCGVGGFALHAARAMPSLEVLGVEVSEHAVASAERTAHDLGLVRAWFRTEDATALTAALRHDAPAAVVVNPPRRGIGRELARALDDSTAEVVIYSSCNPTSLARDAADMPSWRIERAQLFDMFPNTHHAEVLTLLRRHESHSTRAEGQT